MRLKVPRPAVDRDFQRFECYIVYVFATGFPQNDTYKLSVSAPVHVGNSIVSFLPGREGSSFRLIHRLGGGDLETELPRSITSIDYLWLPSSSRLPFATCGGCRTLDPSLRFPYAGPRGLFAAGNPLFRIRRLFLFPLRGETLFLPIDVISFLRS